MLNHRIRNRISNVQIRDDSCQEVHHADQENRLYVIAERIFAVIAASTRLPTQVSSSTSKAASLQFLQPHLYGGVRVSMTRGPMSWRVGRAAVLPERESFQRQAELAVLKHPAHIIAENLQDISRDPL
jgi:hypothetical protein